MNELTQRQVQILRSIVEEYIDSGDPVGSETLEKKHGLEASPATIRNEMVRLTNLGYLKKAHISSGRIPTSQGLKFYIKQLMKERELSVTEEVDLKERVWDLREQEQACLRELTKTLANKTRALAIATTNQGDFFAAGYANLLDIPEFYDIDITKSLFSALDEVDYFNKLAQEDTIDEEIHILLDDELGPRLHGPYGFVFTTYKTHGTLQGQIGVLGPNRLNYNNVVPTVRYFGHLIEELAKGW